MSSTYANHLKLHIFGQSHSDAIGMTLEGIPEGLPVDLEKLQTFLSRRAPGNNPWSTPRKEPDCPEFIGGFTRGITNAEPITAIIRNTNTRSKDYENLKVCPRPGHADYTAVVKFGRTWDNAGGGQFSGRLTAPMCIAGGLCKQWLEAKGIQIAAHLLQVAHIRDTPFDEIHPQLDQVGSAFPVLNESAGNQMVEAILNAKNDGDSVGGIIECAVTGLPVGLGDAMFDGMESQIAHIVFGIPGVKGVEFGSGFQVASMRGSENNDPFSVTNGTVTTVTNHCGGILGGITNAMPLLFRVAMKPTPSIAIAQQSVNLDTMQSQTLQIRGRHDPCIAPRAVPVVEAAVAIAIYDAFLAGNS